MKIFNWFKKSNRINTPAIFQMEMVECGAVCLSIIMAYFGRFISLEQMRVDCGVSRDGCKASNLIRAAELHGFEAEGYRIGVDDFDSMNLPFIAYWHFNHFVVIEGYSDTHIYFNDPAYGHRIMAIKDFAKEYSGIAIEVTPTNKFTPQGNPPRIYTQLLKRLSGQRITLLYIFLVGLAITILGLATPIFGKIFVDYFLIDYTQSILKLIIIGVLATTILRLTLSIINNHYKFKLQNKLTILDSEKFLWHVLRLPLAFFGQRSVGEIINRMQSIDEASEFVGNVFIQQILSLLLIIVYFPLLLYFDLTITTILIIVTLLNITFFYYIAKTRKEKSLLLSIDFGNYVSECFSALRLIESIKSSGAEQDAFKKVVGFQVKVSNAVHSLSEKAIIATTVPGLLNQLANVAILSVGALKIMNGEMSVGTLVAIQSIAASLMVPIIHLINTSGEIQEMVGKMAKLDDVLEYPIESQVNPLHLSQAEHLANEDNVKLKGHIRLENLTFGYNIFEEPIINDLSLTINSGEHVAFVGTSGSGKSTLSKLISNLIQPWHGKIYIDNKELIEINKLVLANSIAMVEQDSHFFNGTLKDNLTMWDKTISQREIIEGTRDAHIHNPISRRPEGYETILAENGTNFSGGERQRIELARAIIANPSILILDEATSELDPIVEDQIYDSIRKIGCTTIIIAHRLDTVVNADKIVVLDKGKIVQIGTHAELISTQGLYMDLMKTA